jgi:integrase
LIREDIERDPTRGVGIINKPPAEQKEVGIFTDVEYLLLKDDKIYQNINHYVGTQIALEAALRRGEILALQWEQIDFENKIITVDRAWKLDKIGLPKWNKTRIVPLSVDLEIILQKHYEDSVYVGVNDFVICWPDGSPVSSGSWQRWFAHVCKKLKIDAKTRNLKPHSYRHTCITRWEQKGIQPDVVQAMAGHSERKTTKLYIHYQPDFLVKAVRG